MFYGPHGLYKQVILTERDEFNRIISKEERWEYVGQCRCDDNTTEKFEDNSGRVFIPKYKIVADRHPVNEGDQVQCRVTGTDEVRGEGRVLNVTRCNYLDYMTIYVTDK